MRSSIALPAGASVERKMAVVDHLAGRVYGVFDAARDAGILSVISAFGGEAASLFEGEAGRRLAAFAPYLIEVPTASMLLRVLLQEGWGNSWGIYAAGHCSFTEARAHLRGLLLVKSYAGTQYYFRYYDPRVMRAYLPSCQLEDLPAVFGPFQQFVMEDENPRRMLLFDRQRRRPEVIRVGGKR